MSFSSRFLSFRPVAAMAVFALVAACSSKTDSSPKTECTSQAYPNLACGKIDSCASGKGSACTGVYLALPDGKKFNCASCSDCKQAQDDAVAACGGAGGETPGTGGQNEQDAAPPAEQNDTTGGEGNEGNEGNEGAGE